MTPESSSLPKRICVKEMREKDGTFTGVYKWHTLVLTKTAHQGWYIQVTRPDGTPAYDGWWVGSVSKSRSAATHEACRVAGLWTPPPVTRSRGGQPLGKRQAVRQFYADCPDDELTLQDLMTKFEVGKHTANDIVKHLKQEGLIEAVTLYRLTPKVKASIKKLEGKL